MLQIHMFVFVMSLWFTLSVDLAQIWGHDKVKEQTHSINSSKMDLWHSGRNSERERGKGGGGAMRATRLPPFRRSLCLRV